jgi:hypothetical protein
MVLAWLYFRSFRVTRPPIGVFNLRDVLLIIGAVVLIPYLYLAARRGWTQHSLAWKC